jgi:hypothetical protein
MRGVASTLAQTQAADPHRFAPVESMTADVTPCGRNDDGPLVVPVTQRNIDSQ